MLNKLTRLKIGLLFVLAHSVSGVAQAEKLPAVVALFGDSITVGYIPCCDDTDYPKGFLDRTANGTTERGEPTRLLKALLGDGIPERPAIVTNWGIGGTSSGEGKKNSKPGDGVARISSVLATAKNNYEGSPYIVLIMYGTNDFGVGLGASDTRFNIRVMIEKARNLGFIPIIGNLIPRSDYPNLTDYNNGIKLAANERNAPLVDHSDSFVSFSGGVWSLYNNEPGTSVKLHPTVQGYQMIANNWFNAHLKDLVPTATPPTPLGAISLLLLDDEPTPP